MSELLLELYSEEIPPNLQLNAKKNLHEKIKSLLNDINLKFESIDSFSSPTRLVIFIKGQISKIILSMLMKE